MTRFHTLDTLQVAGRRVLVRVDLNVPMKNGRVSDATRIDRAAETLEELAAAGAKVIALSHFGRPVGADPEHSLAPLVDALAAALPGRTVRFCPHVIGADAAAAIAALQPGQVLLLENLRYHPGEEANDPEFVRALAVLGDAYVNDAFSAAHRAHASTAGLAAHLPSGAGRVMQAELQALAGALHGRPEGVVALVGGSKVSTKLSILQNLTARVSALIVGGAMANTFLLAQGRPVGKSLVERDLAQTALEVLAQADARGCRVLLPQDVVVAPGLQAGAQARTIPLAEVGPDDMILDIGPASVAAIVAAFEGADALVWNGPVGAFEFPPFDQATTALARAAADLTAAGRLVTVAGGGDTNAALAHAGVVGRFSYISSAGGAFLEWLEGRDLPGVAALIAAAG